MSSCMSINKLPVLAVFLLEEYIVLGCFHCRVACHCKIINLLIVHNKFAYHSVRHILSTTNDFVKVSIDFLQCFCCTSKHYSCCWHVYKFLASSILSIKGLKITFVIIYERKIIVFFILLLFGFLVRVGILIGKEIILVFWTLHDSSCSSTEFITLAFFFGFLYDWLCRLTVIWVDLLLILLFW